MAQLTTNYLNPKLEGKPRPEIGGWGVFAVLPVQQGELLAVWGGRVVTGADLDSLPLETRHLTVQVEDDLYLAICGEPEPADYFNHCCDPNAGMQGQISLVALRDISPGEEVCFDYAMTDSSPYDEFECACGTTHCRGRVRGDDWQNAELQQRYRGFFSTYLQRKIDQQSHYP
jgi:uncharacterized protein